MATKYNGAEAASRWIKLYQQENGIPWSNMAKMGDNVAIAREWIDAHGERALQLLDRLSVVSSAATVMYPGLDKTTPGFQDFRRRFMDLVLIYITAIRMMLRQQVADERVN